MDSYLELLLLYRRYLRLRRRQRRRRLRNSEINLTREISRFSHHSFQRLRNQETEFKNYFGMSIRSFDELLARLQGDLKNLDTFLTDRIQPIKMLAITLKYLASGCTFTELHHTFRVESSTISGMIQEVCHCIWSNLRRDCFPHLDKEMWLAIAKGFADKVNFPHCLGAVGSKHIEIVEPAQSPAMFYNNKGYFSIILMAVCDSNYQFIYADIGSYGKDQDFIIFERTSLWHNVKNNSMDIPISESLPGTEPLPYFFVGNDAFPLHKHLITPYNDENSSLAPHQSRFNNRLSKARQCIETAFEILSRKWRVFMHPINADPDYATTITQACCVLYNYVGEKEGFMPFLDSDIDSDIEFDEPDDEARSIRDTLAEHLS